MKAIGKTKCCSCGKYFAGTDNFDAHRTGDYGHDPTRRRCMTDDEMTAKGFASEQAHVSGDLRPLTREVWYRPIQRENVAKRLQALSGMGIVAAEIAAPH